MATVRVEKTSDFTVLSNAFLDDQRLSLKAIGLLSYMLRLPDDWNFTLEWLAGKHKDGLRAIRSAMEELEAAGYVTRGQSREAGKFAGNDYIVREIPDGFSTPSCQNSTTVSPPSCQNAITENSTTATILKPSTKGPSTNPPKPPRGRRGSEIPDWEPELFERFWKAYPRGEDKQGARIEWNKLRPDRKLMKTMSAALERAKASDEWQRGVGIPYACRWLSKRRWEDEARASEISRAEPAMTGEVGAQW